MTERSFLVEPRIASSSAIVSRSLRHLFLELGTAEPGEPAELHVEDVLGLHLG